MSMLSRSTVSRSRHSYREIQPPDWNLWSNQSDWQALQPIQMTDIPCVEVTMPEADWKRIQELVQAHEHYNCHPVVQDAWEKYQLCLRLVE